MRPKPVVLAILDGFGVAPDSRGNAITQAKTPNIDRFIREYPVMTLSASGAEVGLGFGEMGNSEVGHMNIGAGRIYYQTLPRIHKAIADGSFALNKAFLEAITQVKKYKTALHLIGLLSPGNVHASEEHCYALLQLAKKMRLKHVFVHVILDGRDTQYNSAPDFVARLQKKMRAFGVGTIASLSGRFYAMDRDGRWERTKKAYQAIAEGKADVYATEPLVAIEESYKKKIYDEEFVPTVIGEDGKPTAMVSDNDAVIFFNFRADRARQLTEAFALPSFAKFIRVARTGVKVVTMTEYEREIPVAVAYPPIVVQDCLAEVISQHRLKQLHIAETEKYAHITFFLNGTREDPFPGEERKIIPSPKVSSYDKTPEMSAPEITSYVVKAIEKEEFDVVFINFANADMVSHTGNLKAVKKSVSVLDVCLGEIADRVLASDGIFLITADHGNAEEVENVQTKKKDKEHSTNPVPFIIISNQYKGRASPAGDPPEGDLSLMRPVGMLADVAPTMLKLLNLPQPKEMTGRALI